MSCRICKRSSCTESFHSLEEQDLFTQRQTMPDNTDTLRRMIQEIKSELESETKWAKEYQDRADVAETQVEYLKAMLRNAAEALNNAGNDFAAKSAYDAAR